MSEAFFLTLIGMGGVFAFLAFVMGAVCLMAFILSPKPQSNLACVAAAAAVALHEREGEK